MKNRFPFCVCRFVVCVCSMHIRLFTIHFMYPLRGDVNAQIYHMCISAKTRKARVWGLALRRSNFTAGVYSHIFLHSFVKLLLAHSCFFCFFFCFSLFRASSAREYRQRGYQPKKNCLHLPLFCPLDIQIKWLKNHESYWVLVCGLFPVLDRTLHDSTIMKCIRAEFTDSS